MPSPRTRVADNRVNSSGSTFLLIPPLQWTNIVVIGTFLIPLNQNRLSGNESFTVNAGASGPLGGTARLAESLIGAEGSVSVVYNPSVHLLHSKSLQNKSHLHEMRANDNFMSRAQYDL